MIGKNNYVNIRYSKLNAWRGQIGETLGFCDFEHHDYCVRAWLILMRSYWRKGVRSVRDIVSRFAPPIENDTEKYVRFVERWVFGFVSKDTNLPALPRLDYSIEESLRIWFDIYVSMCRFEVSSVYPAFGFADFKRVVTTYKIKF